MADTWKTVGAWLAIVTLLTAAGCNSGGENSAEANLASINGGNSSAKGTDGAAKAPKAPAPAQRPIVKIETSLGDITVRLDPEKAPLTVGNFLDYTEKGFYDQTIFHQVLKNYVILGGGYTAQMTEKTVSPASVRNEARNGRKNVRGTIAMARRPDIIDSATSQFFINVADNPQLDHKDEKTPGVTGPPEEYGYCVFGDVAEGMEVVEKISNVAVHDKGDLERTPTQPVVIKSIRRVQ